MTIVVKLGGEVVAGPHLPAIAADVASLSNADVASLSNAGARVVMVHGGGPQATELQKRLGQTPKIVAGRRITDADALEVMKMTIAGTVNVDLCAAIVAAGGKPVGLHGASALVIRAKRRPPRVVSGAGPDPIDFGHVGDVVSIDGKLLELLSNAGYVPVLACLGAGDDGAIYNINADIVANETAIALGASLFLVTDVPAVLRDVNDPTSRIARMTTAEGKQLVADGVVTKGMIPKLDESFAAIARGVKAVHIVGKLARGDLARAVNEPGSIGTMLVS